MASKAWHALAAAYGQALGVVRGGPPALAVHWRDQSHGLANRHREAINEDARSRVTDVQDALKARRDLSARREQAQRQASLLVRDRARLTDSIDDLRGTLLALADQRPDLFGRELGPSSQAGSLLSTEVTVRIGSWTEPSRSPAHPWTLGDTPRLVSLTEQGNLLVSSTGAPDEAESLVRTILLRLVVGNPAGSVQLTLIDPVGSGQNLAPFVLRLPTELVGPGVYARMEDIDARLRELNDHVERVVQRKLGGTHLSIAEYNAANPAVAVPYKLVGLIGLPGGGWTGRGWAELLRLAANGPRAGVHIIASVDRSAEPSREIDLDALADRMTVVTIDGTTARVADALEPDWPIRLDEPPRPHEVDALLTGDPERWANEARSLPASEVLAPVASVGSAAGLEAVIGLDEEGKPTKLGLGQGVVHNGLVGGMIASGKTNLLRLLIVQLASTYSPDELGMYLVDFKVGVGLNDFKLLPNVRAIATQTDREYGISLLRHLHREIEHRGQLFLKAGTGGEFADYRMAGHALPRLLLVMDEFQVLFGDDDALAREAAGIIEDIVRRGRSFGLHVLLSSQSPSFGSANAKRIYDQMGLRVALRCSPDTSMAILGESNTGGAGLTRQGEAIVNKELGRVDGNRRVRIALMDNDTLRDRVAVLARQADGRYPPPHHFDGQSLARIDRNARLRPPVAVAADPMRAGIDLYLGEPVEMTEFTAVRLERAPRANLIVVGGNEKAAYALLLASAISICAQDERALVWIINPVRPDSEYAGAFDALVERWPSRVRAGRSDDAAGFLTDARDLVDSRRASARLPGGGVYLIVAGLQRWRELRGRDSFTPSEDSAILQQVLADGAELGVHVIAWVDSLGGLERTLTRRGIEHFDLRVAMHTGEGDSKNLIGSVAAARLTDNRALLRNEDWPAGRLDKFKPYGLLEQDEYGALLQSLR